MKPLKRTTALVAYATTSSLVFATPAFAAGGSAVATASPAAAFGPIGIGAATIAVAAGLVTWGMKARKHRRLENAYIEYKMQIGFDGVEIPPEVDAQIEKHIDKRGTSVESLKHTLSSLPAITNPEMRPVISGSTNSISAAIPRIDGSRPARSSSNSRSARIPRIDAPAARSAQPARAFTSKERTLAPEEVAPVVAAAQPVAERSERVARRSEAARGQQRILAGGAYAPRHARKSASQVVISIEPRIKPDEKILSDLESNFSDLLAKPGRHMKLEEALPINETDLASKLPRIPSFSGDEDEKHIRRRLAMEIPEIDEVGVSPMATAAEIAAAGRAAGKATALAAIASKSAKLPGSHVAVSRMVERTETPVVPIRRGPGFVDINDDTFVRVGAVAVGRTTQGDTDAKSYETVHVGSVHVASGDGARVRDSYNVTHGDLLGFRYPSNRNPEPFTLSQSPDTTLSGLPALNREEKVSMLAALPVV
ncbi:MAG: hypothetical protein ACOYIP_06830 [Coriobacteriales bacterium]|jgi:hypothetical protein